MAILDAAVDAASEGGLESLTIGRLSRQLGMSKAGLFTHFGSKEALLVAIVRAARDRFYARVIEPALALPPGLSRLDAVFEHKVAGIHEPCFPGGCFFGKAATEFENRPGLVKDAIIEIVGEWVSFLTETLEQAVVAGELPADTDIELIAFEWRALTQHASRMIQLTGDPRGIELARRSIRARLDALRASVD